MSRLLASACLIFLVLYSSARAENWADGVGNSIKHVSDTACNVMTSGLTKWFVKSEGYTTGGYPAAGKTYAVVPKARIEEIVHGKSSGILVIEQHVLSMADGQTLAKNYVDVAGSSVPYFLQFGSIPFPNLVGAGLTLLDWALHLNTVQRATASDLATLMPSGGTLSKSLAITADKVPPHRWLLQQITFETTVNTQKRSYVVCSWAFPLKE